MKQINILFAILLFAVQTAVAQTGTINGIVNVEGKPTEYATVKISTTNGKMTNAQGQFMFSNLPYGEYTLSASYIGFEDVIKTVKITNQEPNVSINFDLTQQQMSIDQIVVTGTRTVKRQTDSPVIVNVINSETIENLQACVLSESLKFQPGLRVETDCQTCNYTQLRMNGLAGSYSQILINGRPIFSPLTGLYGLEQVPANMIERIEVVRGGGSSLYGSSAIGGTVNVITKLPKTDDYQLNYNYENIDGQTNDHSINGNATIVSLNGNSGASFFMNRRERDFYDANEDNFSEIPKIKNTSIGSSLFFLPKENQKLELNVSYLNEYRFGGEMKDELPAYLTQQSEERTHNVYMASADYQINFNNDNSSLIAYAGWQNTDRKHYTGIQPDMGTAEYNAFLANPPYGTSDVSTINTGLQFNHKVNDFIQGNNVFTVGAEYVYDDVLDDIPAYNYKIDQTTKDVGVFVQSDWELSPKFTLLTGIRMDEHNLIDKAMFSPRTSLLYDFAENAQFRFSYGTGFRAPQAFDTDLHIAFAGGGISRVSLSPELEPERSQSFSTSINYDKLTEHYVAGFTVEAFHNNLEKAFYLNPIGADANGELFEKQNGDGATVKGITLEARANYDYKMQLEAGFTIQSSEYENAVEYIDGVAGIKEFIRTPNNYGYSVLNYTPNDKINTTLNYIYTGKMKVPHFAGAPNQTKDEIIESKPFSELGAKIGYTFEIEQFNNNLEVYSGVKNMFNSYQKNWDIGKNRDSNFIYGPAQPRTLFVGVRLKN